MWTVPRGVIHCPVTPFTADGQVDYSTFEKVVNFHVEHGATSLCIVLHIAESLNLTIPEHKQLIEVAVKATNHRVPVIASVARPGTDETIDLARHAEKAGADAVCCISPYYWRPPEEAQFEHFVALGTAIGIPLIAYHSPKLQDGIGISPRLLVRLIERLPNFVGLKDAGQDVEHFIEAQRVAQAIRPEFTMFPGVEFMVPMMAMGATASMTTSAGVAPNLVENLYFACAKEQYVEARKLQEAACALWQIWKVEYPAPIKAAMEIMGRPVGKTRLPIRPMTEEGKRRLRAQLEQFGILDQEPHGW